MESNNIKNSWCTSLRTEPTPTKYGLWQCTKIDYNFFLGHRCWFMNLSIELSGLHLLLWWLWKSRNDKGNSLKINFCSDKTRRSIPFDCRKAKNFAFWRFNQSLKLIQLHPKSHKNAEAKIFKSRSCSPRFYTT